jgi:Tol biopolymer transport system component
MLQRAFRVIVWLWGGLLLSLVLAVWFGRQATSHMIAFKRYVPPNYTLVLFDVRTHTEHVLADAVSGGLIAWSPDGSALTYEANDPSGNNLYEIYRVRLDGSPPQNLTQYRRNDLSPIWTPDGQYILYERWSNGQTEILRMRPDGTQPQVLRSGQVEYDPLPSPDGKHILFSRSLDNNLNCVCVVPTDDPDRVTELATIYRRGVDLMLQWMPDSQSVLYVHNEGVFRVGIDGARFPQPIVQGVPVYGAVPSPDGQQIAYQTSGITGSGLYVSDADGANLREVPLPDYMRNITSLPAWSPDSAWLVFSAPGAIPSNVNLAARPQFFSVLYRVRPNGDGLHTLTPFRIGTNDNAPVFRPNER